MKRLTFLAVIAIGLIAFGCNRPIFHDGKDLFGLASPITLQGDTTTVVLADYFRPGTLANIDSITGTPELRFNLSEGNDIFKIIQGEKTPPFVSVVNVWYGANSYSLLLHKNQKVRYDFVFDQGDNRYSSVFIRGDMTNWAPVPLHFVDGDWNLQMNLDPGLYQYLLIVDGREMTDPNNPFTVENNLGGTNSQLAIPGINRDLTPHLFPASIGRRSIDVTATNNPEKIIALWQNFQLPQSSISTKSNGTIQITIPPDAKNMERSFLRIIAQNDEGPSNDLLIPLQKGAPLVDPALLTRQDKEATILYFMMVDRFNNGNPDNDDPVIDPEVDDRVNFWGGDIDGITEKIEDGYFQRLGINTIWFTPIAQNPHEAYVEFPEPNRKFTGYHGYWPISHNTVDHRFGDADALRRMVETAHANNMRVLLDFVSNHVHKKNPLIVNNPHFATILDLPDGRKNIRLWDEHRLTTWFDEFLPSLDFSNPEVIQIMVNNAFFWITEFNFDGFRHDATKHVPHEFWRALTLKLKEEYMIPNGKRLLQIGETFGNRDLIGSYVGSGLLDGQFDFNLYFDSRTVFALENSSFRFLDFSLGQSLSKYGFQNLMGNITGNHDMARFISLAGGGLRFDENQIEAGWARDVGVGDPVGYNRLASLTAFIMTIPGVPVIYYGDEIGIPGASDPDSRRPMIFDNLTERQSWLLNTTTKLTNLRQNNLALIYGDFKTLSLDDDFYAYSRTYFNNSAVVLFNKSRKPKTVEVDLPQHMLGKKFEGNFDSNFTIAQNKLTITLEPNSFEVLVAR